jgi:hypothetical protein
MDAAVASLIALAGTLLVAELVGDRRELDARL